MEKSNYITSSEIPVSTSMSQIRDLLAKIGVDGMSVDTRYDLNTGAALVRFSWNGNNYERRSIAQPNVSKNMRVIYLNLKQKVLDHLRGVETFGDSMYKYKQLSGTVDTSINPAKEIRMDATMLKAYDTLQIDPYSTSEACEEAYKRQLKAWHPDRHATDKGMQDFANKKTSEINEAWGIVKKHRNITP